MPVAMPQQQASRLGQYDMRDRVDPTFTSFEPGDEIEGVLHSIERITVGAERTPCTRYTVLNLGTGEMVAFLGTTQINSRLAMRDVGHYIAVCCTGTDPKVERNGNHMKLFRIAVSLSLARVQVVDGSPEAGKTQAGDSAGSEGTAQNSEAQAAATETASHAVAGSDAGSDAVTRVRADGRKKSVPLGPRGNVQLWRGYRW